jgi:hypothetical protein
MGARPQGGREPRSQRLRGLLAPAAVAALIAALVSSPRLALADDAQEFEGARARVDSGEYDEALKRFAVMLDAKNPPCPPGATNGGCRLTDKDLLVQARMNHGTLLWVFSKKEREADEQFAAILRQNPTFRPSAANFPQAAVDRFDKVRADLKPELDKLDADRMEKARKAKLAELQAEQAEKDRIKELERLAGQETVIDENSRWLALLPFGVGQFQNGDKNLGWLFLTTEILSGATAIVSGIVVQDTINETVNAQATGQRPDLPAQQAKITAGATVNRVSFGIFAGVAVIGVVQAQLGFVPAQSFTRKRSIQLPAPAPSAPNVAPTVSIGPGGASLGLVGRF